MLRRLSLALGLVALATPAFAQSSPGLVTGQVPTAAQWNSYFAAKQDVLGFTPLNRAGGVMLGPLITIGSSTTNAGLRIPAGTAPTSPVNGDVWTTTTGMFVRINGVTIGPLSAATGGSFAATVPLAVTFPASVVTYALNIDANFAVVANNLAFASIASGNLLANCTAGAAAPTTQTFTTCMDRNLGSTQGNITYRNATVWTVLAPGTAGALLQSGGAGANVQWTTAAYPTLATANQLLYSSSTNLIAGLATANNGVLVTSAGGVPSISSTIPTATQDNITRLGTIVSGVWNGTIVTGQFGGTGIANTGLTITLGGNLSTAAALTHAGAFATTITATGITNSTLPAGTHTLAGLDVTQSWTANQIFTDTNLVLAGATSGTLNLRAPATAGTSVIRFPAGSTDFSATGGTAQVLFQASAGGPITVARPTCSTLSDAVAFCSSTDAAGLTGTVAAARLAGSYTGITGVGTLTAGALGSGFTVVALAQGGSGQATAAAARAATGFNVESFTGRGDANYVILTTDKVVGTNATFTAARTFTLPAASAVNPGQPLVVADYQGTVTPTNTLTIQRAGSDTVNGGTAVTIAAANGAYALYSDGISKFTAQALGAAAAGGVSSVTCGDGLQGGVITTSGTCSLWFDPASITNCSISAAVAGNNVTISLLGKNGATPSASNPCFVSFRNVTAATGDYTVISITAATTFVANAGSHFGTANAEATRLYAVGFNDGGTFRLGVINAVSYTQSTGAMTIFPLDDTGIASSTTCAACTNATSAGVFYSSTGVTAKAYRVLGFATWDAGQATAGTWATGVSVTQSGTSILPGRLKRPIQFSCNTQSSATGTTFITSCLTQAITLASPVNLVRVAISGGAASDQDSTNCLVRLRQAGTVIGPQMGPGMVGATLVSGRYDIVWHAKPNTAASVTYDAQNASDTVGALCRFILPASGQNGVMSLEEIQG